MHKFDLTKTKNVVILVTVLIVAFILYLFFYLNNSYNQAINEFRNKNYSAAYEEINKVKGIFPLFRKTGVYEKEIASLYYMQLGDKSFKDKNYDDALHNYNLSKDSIQSEFIDKKIAMANKEIEKIKAAEKAKKEAEKKAKQAKINNLKSKMRIKYDKVEGITFYFDKTSPIYINQNTFLIYIGKKDNDKWLRFRMTYAGDDWIFFDTVIFNIDGERIQLNYDRLSDINSGTVYGGDLYESYETLCNGKYLNLVKKVMNSKHAVMRFRGQGQYDKTITQTEKNAIKRVLELYDLM